MSGRLEHMVDIRAGSLDEVTEQIQTRGWEDREQQEVQRCAQTLDNQPGLQSWLCDLRYFT